MAPWTFQGLQEGVVSACQGIAVTVQNPTLRRHKFLKIFIYLSIISFILLGLANVLISIPIQIVRSILWLSSSDKAMHADDALNSISKLIRELISSVPFMVLLFMRYVYPRPLNELFMESLRYLDKTHPDRAPYCAPLLLQKTKKTYWKDMKDYVVRSWKKLRIGMLLLLLSFIPVIGRFVFPLAGAYTSYRALGNTQGVVVGICFFFLPRWATMKLVRALLGMRALMRELLEPYFSKMNMTHKEKQKWFSGRKDVLFGFSAIAYIMIRLPVIGILGYGIAQASAAYMLTIVTAPPNIEKQKLQQKEDKEMTASEPKKKLKANEKTD